MGIDLAKHVFYTSPGTVWNSRVCGKKTRASYMRAGNINQPTEPLGVPTCTVSILSKMMGWANPNNKTTSNVSIGHKFIRGFPVSIPVLHPHPEGPSMAEHSLTETLLRPFCLIVLSQTLQHSKTRTYNILPDMYICIIYLLYIIVIIVNVIVIYLSLIIYDTYHISIPFH